MILHEPCAADPVEELLASLEPLVARLFVRFKIPPQDHEDLLQEALLAFVAKRKSVVTPRAWLFSAVRNQCRFYWARRRRSLFEALDEKILDTLADPRLPVDERTQLGRDLLAVLRRLPQRCRTIFRLRYVLGCDAPEVAQRLGYQAESVRHIASRCIAALSAELCAVGLNWHRARGNHE